MEGSELTIAVHEAESLHGEDAAQLLEVQELSVLSSLLVRWC